jgi:peptidyl-tRNA hydrolase
VDYVLGDFLPEEQPVLKDVMHRVGDAVVCLLTAGLNAAMNKFNTEPKNNIDSTQKPGKTA